MKSDERSWYLLVGSDGEGHAYIDPCSSVIDNEVKVVPASELGRVEKELAEQCKLNAIGQESELKLLTDLTTVRDSHRRQCELNDSAWARVKELELELTKCKTDSKALKLAEKRLSRTVSAAYHALLEMSAWLGVPEKKRTKYIDDHMSNVHFCAKNNSPEELGGDSGGDNE